MSETNTTVLVITESDREQLIKWLSNLPSATLNQPIPTEAPSETQVEETAAEATAEEQAPVAQEAAPEVSVESQT